MTGESDIAIVDTTRMMTAAEARELTEKIRSTAGALWALLLEAHEREAWRALGYASWRDYAKVEFAMSQSRAYQLLDAGRVARAVQASAGISTTVEMSERDARRLKPRLADVTTAIRDRVHAGQDAAEVVRDVVHARDSYSRFANSRKRVDRSNRIVAHIVMDATLLLADVSMVKVEELDVASIPEWAASLRLVATDVRKYADWLERGTVSSRRDEAQTRKRNDIRQVAPVESTEASA